MLPAAESALGPRLRNLREARGLSRAQVERMGGLGDGTLKTWESGSRIPREAALSRLLDVLGATPGQRAEIVALAHPLRARLLLDSHPSGAPIDLGILLRAFRFRKGWTQKEAAEALGVTQGAVAHWESGGRVLEGSALHHALFVLGATPDEVATALAHPHCAEPESEDPVDVQQAIERIPGVLREPALLANERILWFRAAREPEWEFHLRGSMVQRAIWYAFARRFGEVEPLLRRLRQMTPDPNADARSVGASIVLGDVRFRPDAPPPLALAQGLEATIPTLGPSVVRAWALGTQAVGLAAAGDARAVELARRALDEAVRFDHRPVEAWHRRVDLAEVHLRLGEPDRALEAIGDEHLRWDYPAWSLGIAPAGLPVRARALAALGRAPEPELMDALRAHATVDGTPFYQDRFAEVERALSKIR